MSNSQSACASDSIESWEFNVGRDSDVFDRLRSVTTDMLMPFEAEARDLCPTLTGTGHVRRIRFGDLAIVDSVMPETFSGVFKTVSRRGPARLIVTTTVQGEEYVEQGGRSAVLRPGSLFVVDGNEKGTFVIRGKLRARNLVLPRDLAPNLTCRPWTHLSSSSPYARLLSSYIASLAQELPLMSAPARKIAADTAMYLLDLTSHDHFVPVDPVPLRLALLPVLRGYIEPRLGDPELSPTSIAAANAISLRTLHATFAAEGESVSSFIRRRRLENSRRDLVAEPGLTVARIATRWGFTNPGNFTRAFRANFGVSPTEVRSDSLGDASS